jgi:nucleoside-diphosphate-sugar epimerase
MENSKMVLILGGSTFMGKTLLTRLKDMPEYKTLFVNRGRKYWYERIYLGMESQNNLSTWIITTGIETIAETLLS